MTKEKSLISYLPSRHDLVVGFLTFVCVVSFGVSIGIALGVLNVPTAEACCVIPPAPTPPPPPPPPPIVIPPIIIPPVVGCMDHAATNYNPNATAPAACTYPAVSATIYGCMDPLATNYNPHATVDDGSCVYPNTPALPTCTLTANPTSVNSGATSVLSWTTVNATTFSIDHSVGAAGATHIANGSTTTPAISTNTIYTGTATGAGGTAHCTATVTIITGGGSGGTTPACTLTASPTAVSSGATSVLSWTTTNATSFSINAGIGAIGATHVASGSTTTPALSADTTYTGIAKNASGATATCTATVTITTGGGGAGGCTSNCGGGAGGGAGGSSSGGGGGAGGTPNIVLSTLPHIGAQPLVLYLSQIPYTGLDLGPVGTATYWVVLIGISIALTYFILFVIVPLTKRSAHTFGAKVGEALNTPAPASARAPVAPSAPARESHVFASVAAAPEAVRGYSTFDGFKSFAHKEALSIDDIVKGLSRQHIADRVAPPATPAPAPVAPRVEPIYDHVDPLDEIPEPIQAAPARAVLADVRGFAIALLQGDREGVFIGLRQHVRGRGAPEYLLSNVTCLLDDVYRARVDGSPCDSVLERIAARLDTPKLEMLVAALTTAIDSSYASGVTGAKLALTRALAVLGA